MSWLSRSLCTNRNMITIFRAKLHCQSELIGIKQWLSEFPGGCVRKKKIDDDIVSVEWEHIRRHNAFTGSMISQLDDIISELELSCPKGVIFSGANGSFCAGGDLNFLHQISSADDGTKTAKYMQHLTTRITCLPAISVALIDGPALGSGAELALCADFRLATPTARIGFKQARMGITTAWGGGARLVSIVGREAAMKLLLSGEDILPEDALRLHLYDYLITGERLQSSGGRYSVNNPCVEALKWLDRLIGKVPINVVHSTKKIIQQPSFTYLTDAVTKELDQIRDLWGDKEHLNALQAAKPTKSHESK